MGSDGWNEKSKSSSLLAKGSLAVWTHIFTAVAFLATTSASIIPLNASAKSDSPEATASITPSSMDAAVFIPSAPNAFMSLAL